MDLKSIEKIASTCTLCDLHAGRNLPVFYKGNPQADIIICGMVPADEENNSGLPFVGKAGKLLDVILNEVGLGLDCVYITNLVKCYLAAGKPLKEEWVDSCLPYLIAQIGVIQPKVIITLGKDASGALLEFRNKPLGKVRGKFYDYGYVTKIVPTYHPAYLVRYGGTSHRNYNDVIEDFLLAKRVASGEFDPSGAGPSLEN